MYQSIFIFGFILLQSSQSVYGLEHSSEQIDDQNNNLNLNHNNNNISVNDNLSDHHNNVSLSNQKDEFLNKSDELTQPFESNAHDDPLYNSNIISSLLSGTILTTTTEALLSNPSTLPSTNAPTSTSKTTVDHTEPTYYDSVEETTPRAGSLRNLKFPDSQEVRFPDTNSEESKTLMLVAKDSEDYEEIQGNDYEETSILETPETIVSDQVLIPDEPPVEDTTLTNDLENKPEENDNFNQTTTSPSKQNRVLKMSPDEILKSIVDDVHLRSPIAALVDKKQNPLTKAKQLWKASLRPNAPLDIVLVSYDGEGEPILNNSN